MDNIPPRETETKQPHAGNPDLPAELREVPVETFDMSLEEANNNNKISPLPVEEAPEPVYGEVASTPAERSKKPLVIGAIGAVAASAIAVGAWFGLKPAAQEDQNANIPPAPNPNETSLIVENPAEGTGTDTDNTTETETETSTDTGAETGESAIEKLINEKKIESGLTPKAFADTLISDRLPKWYLAGANEEYFNEASANSTGGFEIEDRIAAEQANINANALFVPGWNSIESLTVAKDNIQKQNSSALVDWRKAHDFDGSLGTPDWQEGMVVENAEVLEDGEGGRKLYITGYQTNNAAETSNSSSPNADLNGQPFDFTITTTIIDGFEYVSEWVD